MKQIKLIKAILVVSFLVVLTGCGTIIVAPTIVPDITEQSSLSLFGAIIQLENIEKKDQDKLLFSIGPATMYGNPKDWTGTFIAALDKELTKRGARVSGDAPVVIKVSMPEITGRPSRGPLFVTVTAKVEIGKWSKTYTAERGSVGAGFGPKQPTHRAASAAMGEVIKQLLMDQQFTALLL